MDFLKKHWKWITLIAVLVIAGLLIMHYKKKPTTASGKISTTGDKTALKAQLAACEQNATGIRLSSGAEHPCQKLRDQYAVA